MRAVTAGATDAIGQMRGAGKVLRLQAGLMALGADGSGLGRTQLLEANDLGDVATAVDMRLSRPMAGLASVLIAFQQGRVGRVCEVFVPDFLMTSLTDVGVSVLGRGTRERAGGLWRSGLCARENRRCETADRHEDKPAAGAFRRKPHSHSHRDHADPRSSDD